MRKIFVDTSYWIAVLNPTDSLHDFANNLTLTLFPSKLVTSELILNELLNHYSGSGSRFREIAVNLILQIQEDENMEVVPITSQLFANAFQLYAQRQDKAWSHTDCSSFCIMQELGIIEALTYDKHFEQVGFVALLRN
ncbi:MAG: type II toxin-antitoxin system VapC family toxin [Pseudanabaena sp. M135S2SP2A07QC]|jgi:predicted nucleic acid-binding protein|nr:type II toxin-antitoxin system VapC family toxin [Pseudanabaena sp. M110S1SP2A07QC]MCA6522314.1 type II toxin-antitoxin system VapC family toxin [Pseudanabaena sp. M051S1SP2A07QC]MCA6527800.1 type II toxin-antitoxin system VapC family toxin [Pseudanabaena sp. M179S2SP2A07QC]MCA6529632.1 type II toxin-antitoxin system VapC family toxin [Pseudanabaena sp. M125S2SP2A07QC]MCA6536774.1 type II toxin-antitoxin system VapC family toxin [Pseudanabaena sp. M176S2SP2A07QC]MCA6541211.1 type II toxin-a